MVSITEFYSITRPVPFVDVGVDVDNHVYLDPRAVRLRVRPQPYASQAARCADTFLGSVVDCVLDGSRAAVNHGRQLLERFVEPWETRCGMAQGGFRGHGGAAVVGGRIWDAFAGDLEALVRVGILHQLEDLPVFVHGIDKDITSDITTRLFFEPLGRFTEQMIADYPEFTAGDHEVGQFTKQVWNPDTRRWCDSKFTLPVVEGQPLVLIPGGWARPTLLMSSGRYYETTVLSFAQREQAVVLADGKILNTRKRDLMKQPGLERSRTTSRLVTMRALANDHDLLMHFKRFVDERYGRGENDDALAA